MIGYKSPAAHLDGLDQGGLVANRDGGNSRSKASQMFSQWWAVLVPYDQVDAIHLHVAEFSRYDVEVAQEAFDASRESRRIGANK
jgi:hypothetical protein